MPVAIRCQAGHAHTNVQAGRWHGHHSINVATEGIYYLLNKYVKLTRLYTGNKFTACEEELNSVKDLRNATLRISDGAQ